MLGCTKRVRPTVTVARQWGGDRARFSHGGNERRRSAVMNTVGSFFLHYYGFWCRCSASPPYFRRETCCKLGSRSVLNDTLSIATLALLSGTPSSSSARTASRNFMSLRLLVSYGAALTSQDDPTCAYHCVGFVLRDMLCICHSPGLTLHSTPTPTTGQKSLSCAFLYFIFFPLSLIYRPPPTFIKLTSSRLSSSSLPSAGKSYVWLAFSDIFSVAVFVWEAFSQWFDSSSESLSQSSRVTSRSAARLWLALTFRQTCFLIISALILINVRRRKSVSFGYAHSCLWVPVLFIASVSTVAAGFIADRIPGSFLIGYIVYSSTTAILNTVVFGSLVGGLIIIRRSLANFELEQARKESKPVGEEAAEKPPQLTLDIEAIREGSLWFTSAGSSHRRDEPDYPYSDSTTSSRMRATQNITISSDQATPPRSTVWPPQGTHSSTSSRNPSLRRDDIHTNDFGYAPSRHRTQSLRAAAAAAAALTVSSPGSWISSSLGTRPTLSAWSYSTPRSSPPSRAQSAVEDVIALASDHRAPSAPQAERGTTSPASAATRSQEIEVSTLRILAWLAGVWAPLVCLFIVVTI
jgi:hypothetical protein